TDIMAYNTYPGWYWAQPSTMKSSVAHWNGLVGSKGICVSEYGAGANIWHHQQDVQSAPKTDGIFHPEEWQAIVHEQNYRGISSSDFVWGSFVWNMFDFASASRNEGDILGLNDKGLVTYDRKVKKDAFYFYQSAWSESPVLHITSKRDIARREPATDIKIYSNCDNIRLKVNGQDCGHPDREDNILIWKNVSLKKGENRIEASGKKGTVELTDQCKWVLLDKKK
ncbi:glycoside hydrolase family 2 protein, partial [Bacteroides salyersiae]